MAYSQHWPIYDLVKPRKNLQSPLPVDGIEPATSRIKASWSKRTEFLFIYFFYTQGSITEKVADSMPTPGNPDCRLFLWFSAVKTLKANDRVETHIITLGHSLPTNLTPYTQLVTSPEPEEGQVQVVSKYVSRKTYFASVLTFYNNIIDDNSALR